MRTFLVDLVVVQFFFWKMISYLISGETWEKERNFLGRIQGRIQMLKTLEGIALKVDLLILMASGRKRGARDYLTCRPLLNHMETFFCFLRDICENCFNY